MKRFVSLGTAVVLSMIVLAAPVRAGDESRVAQQPATFYALSELPADGLAALPDDQLASVRGAVDICVICVQRARITQVNVAVDSFDVNQLNAASITQEIN